MSLFADKVGVFYRFLMRESGKVSKLENQSKQLVRMKSLFNDPSPTVVDQLEIYFSQPVNGKSSKKPGYFTVRLTIRAFILTTSHIRVG